MSLRLLFVCTGNTCRSPLAEGLARSIFGDLAQVSSAGIEAWEGEKASAHAMEVLMDHHVDLSPHRARRLTGDLLANADWIIPMTKTQEESLKRRFPHEAPKIRCLGSWGEEQQDIIDPYGGTLEVYRQTAQEIGELLRGIKEQLLLSRDKF